MRRGRRELRQKSYSRNLLFLVGGFLLLIILTFAITFAVYNNKLKNSTYSTLTAEKIAELVPNDVEGDSQEVEQASTEIGKTIEEAINTMENKIEENQNNTTEENTEKTTSVQTEESNKQIEEVAEKPVVIKDPEFIRPVEGEVARNFAKDTLIYSETLDEWITHLGIDIKAERTTVVKSAEKGKVIAIKNDPRYGLTVIVDYETEIDIEEGEIIDITNGYGYGGMLHIVSAFQNGQVKVNDGEVVALYNPLQTILDRYPKATVLPIESYSKDVCKFSTWEEAKVEDLENDTAVGYNSAKNASVLRIARVPKNYGVIAIAEDGSITAAAKVNEAYFNNSDDFLVTNTICFKSVIIADQKINLSENK